MRSGVGKMSNLCWFFFSQSEPIARFHDDAKISHLKSASFSRMRSIYDSSPLLSPSSSLLSKSSPSETWTSATTLSKSNLIRFAPDAIIKHDPAVHSEIEMVKKALNRPFIPTKLGLWLVNFTIGRARLFLWLSLWMPFVIRASDVTVQKCTDWEGTGIVECRTPNEPSTSGSAESSSSWKTKSQRRLPVGHSVILLEPLLAASTDHTVSWIFHRARFTFKIGQKKTKHQSLQPHSFKHQVFHEGCTRRDAW